ncbi:isopenicillin N synthase family oxygenase [Rhodobacter capsulatus]|uniref:2-oxoglutarate-dependent ethylene/succinate-forming enzyme n=1 Tax=Rhodobacter capsulatus TaxID=1061 RepID=A0A4U1JNG1_RHOCA|nr:2-oxoglutarate and iron-dependent oxygenase domain-containing protein [Rhodobacter capsulatus]TKD14542.1 isopenicillin N synthase family oxygenase [Rhodobacter capsulatus]
MTAPHVALPILDFSLFRGTAEDRAAFVDDLRRALHDDGFFYLSGHGVPKELIAALVAASKRFFALPMAEKLQIEMVKSPHFRGYNRAGFERTRGEQDWREQIDFNTEGTARSISPDSPGWARLFGPNQWPEAVPELKEIVLSYQTQVTAIGIDLLKAIALALGQPEDAFAAVYEPQPTQLLKLIRYPGRDVAQSDQGVGAHKDGGLITILLQHEVPGLRVQTVDGRWIDAPPVPGTFVINTGELLELATNGFVRADVHDVIAPPPGVERFSFAFFLGARYDATIPVLPLPEDLRSLERGLSVDPLNPLFRNVGQNHLKSRLRSHPDVALAHHVDLLAELAEADPA